MPFQRRHVVRRRHDAPPVRGDSNAHDLRRSQIITKVQRTPQRTLSECPSSVATHSPVATSHTLSVLSLRPRHDAPPVRKHGNAATYDEARSSQKYSGRRNARRVRVPFQRRHAFAGRHVPDLERVVARRRHDAPPVRKHRNAPDLRRSQIITKVQWTPQRTLESSALPASPRICRSPRPTP